MSQEGSDYRPAAAELQSIAELAQEGGVDVKAAPGQKPRHLETVLQIPVSVKIVLGSATMPVASVLKLGRGAVVPLDRKVGEPVDHRFCSNGLSRINRALEDYAAERRPQSAAIAQLAGLDDARLAPL